MLTALVSISCSEIRTNDPIESYKYWASGVPMENIKLLEGQYWQSSHWTKEYELYLKFIPTTTWWTEFITQNHLVLTKEEWDEPSDLPDWFIVDENFEMYKPTNDFYNSRYFRDTKTGECYLYEIQF